MKPATEEHALLFVGSHVTSSTWWWQDAPDRRQQKDKLHWERSQQLILSRFFHIWKTQADTFSMCVHEQHTPVIQQDNITTAAAYCPLRGRGGKMRAKWGSHPKQEVGDWKKNLYLPMSSSDSSASDQLSKSRNCVRMNLRPSAACICVYEQKYVAKHKKAEERGRATNSGEQETDAEETKPNGQNRWTHDVSLLTL